jgi:hypothetical protein
MGDISDHGWWYYFPVTMLLKTPLLTFAMLALALWDTVRGKRWAAEAPVLTFPVVYVLLALSSPLNIGYRYLLPIIPFLLLYGGKVAGLTWIRPSWLRTKLLPLFLTIYAGVSLWLHPHYLAYFNVLAGGPSGGHRYLVDSNLDWGQDLKLLSEYLDEQGLDNVWLGYFGSADPSYYGIGFRHLFPPGSSRTAEDFAPISPAPGWYAISATALQGPFSVEADVLDWFRRHDPVAKIGYSIFVYHVVEESNPPEWIGVCYAPDPALDDNEVQRRTGQDDLRLVGFDCRQSWVIPAGGGPGLYLVPAGDDGHGSPADVWLAESEVVYRERGIRGGAAYTVYRWDGPDQAHPPELNQEAWASPALAPSPSDPLRLLEVPSNLGDQVAFMGFAPSEEALQHGEELAVTTGWRVLARPDDPALSLFAHLVARNEVVSNGDGLGFPAIQWEPGDAFYQISTLVLPAQAPAADHWVQVGLYSLATGERVPVVAGGEPVSERLLLRLIRLDADE